MKVIHRGIFVVIVAHVGFHDIRLDGELGELVRQPVGLVGLVGARFNVFDLERWLCAKDGAIVCGV